MALLRERREVIADRRLALYRDDSRMSVSERTKTAQESYEIYLTQDANLLMTFETLYVKNRN